jgi:hypothetical protein
MKASLVLWPGLFLAVSLAAHAGPVGPLKSFSSGTRAIASEVNGNFDAVSTAVNDNDSRVSTLEGVNAAGRLTTLEGVNAAGRLTTLEGINAAGRLTTLEGVNAAGRLTTLEGVNAAGRLTTLEGVNAAGRLTTLELDGVNAASRLTTLEGVNAASRLTTLEGVNAASRLTTLEAANAAARITALEAQLAASVACPANTPTRFTDNGDGTICDSQTGLMWEKKTGTVGTLVFCTNPANCPDPHDVNNLYTWTAGTPEPNGTLYSDFLGKLNDLESPNDGTTTTCFVGHCDWRVPTIGELRSILQAPNPNCAASPCIDGAFAGPTQADLYWSSSSNLDPSFARNVNFNDCAVGNAVKGATSFARAVRGGR